MTDRMIDKLATTVEIAALTNDRTDQEQRDLLAAALHIDCERGAFVSGNYRAGVYPMRPRLVALIEASREVSDWPADGQREVKLTKQQAERYNRLLINWQTCDRCSQPRAVHNRTVRGGNDHLTCPPEGARECIPVEAVDA